MKWEEIVRIAKDDIGKSRDEVGCPGDYAWCAAWVSSVLNKAGVGEGVESKSCTKMQLYMSQNVLWYEPIGFPEPGDILFFDWDHNKEEELPLDHVGIVLAFDENTLQITYANGNGSSPHYVTKQFINLEASDSEGNKLVAYWMRYIGDLNERPAEDDHKEPEKEPENEPEEKPVAKEVVLKVRQLRKGMSGGDVKSLQRLLFADDYSVGQCGDDGDFGPDTEKAVIKYQYDHDLDADGIAGINTLTALWNCKSLVRKSKKEEKH